MKILAGRITLDFYGNDKVSKKRALLNELAQLVRRKWGLELLEVDQLDNPEICVVGFAIVQRSQSAARKLATQVLEYLETHSGARVVTDEIEISDFDALSTPFPS
jgi:uncharacterized protein YlxP (DUF503 family)